MIRPRPADAPAVGSVVVGRYELRRFLSVSGYGCVYEAVTPGGAAVALKTLVASGRGDGDGQLLERFEREIEILGGLNHPNIVPLLDAGFDEHTGMPYLVMPLLEGFDMAQLVERVGPLHPTVVARMFCQVCEGLDAAHDRRIVHRGIKPSNVFLDHQPDGSVTVRLLDFGLAKLLGSEADTTRTGTMLGTPRYMAPEQLIESKTVDARADVWGVGTTMFTALTGQPPYEDAVQLPEVVDAIVYGEPLQVQQHAPWVEPELASVVDAAMLSEIDARCPSARALQEALVKLTGDSLQVETTMLDGVQRQLIRQAAQMVVTRMWDKRTQANAATVVLEPFPFKVGDELLGKELGGYTLVGKLGRGGMGVVYDGESRDGTKVAVKVMWQSPSDDALGMQRRFVREARATMKIDSPHVVSVLAADTDAQLMTPFIVMEKMNGLDVGRLIKRYGLVEPSFAARLIIDACHGVAAAHALEIIHRDIKPSNIFLHHSPSGTVQVKICDFGIAKQLGEVTQGDMLTRTDRMIGSPHYMSPEQTKDAKTVDRRSDVWSLGISLYKMLSGQTPWGDGSSVGQVVLAICTEDAPPVRDKAPWVPQGLEEVIRRALCRAPGSRYASVEELADALRPYAAPGAIAYYDLLTPFVPPAVPDEEAPISLTATGSLHAQPPSDDPAGLRSLRSTVRLPPNLVVPPPEDAPTSQDAPPSSQDAPPSSQEVDLSSQETLPIPPSRRTAATLPPVRAATASTSRSVATGVIAGLIAAAFLSILGWVLLPADDGGVTLGDQGNGDSAAQPASPAPAQSNAAMDIATPDNPAQDNPDQGHPELGSAPVASNAIAAEAAPSGTTMAPATGSAPATASAPPASTTWPGSQRGALPSAQPPGPASPPSIASAPAPPSPQPSVHKPKAVDFF